MNLQKFLKSILKASTNCACVFSKMGKVKNKIEEKKALGKEALIIMAQNIISNKYPSIKINLNDYEITAWYNSTELVVKLKRLIRYIPLDKSESIIDYDLSINVITQEISPVDIWGIENFFMPTDEDLKNMEFVKNIFHLPVPGFENKVYEEADSYQISLDNEAAFGRYYIDKISGKEMMESMGGSYIPKPLPELTEETIDNDPLKEIIE